MAFVDSVGKLFGVTFSKNKEADNLSASLAPPIDDEGSAYVSSVGNYGVYLDTTQNVSNELLNIQKYREISLYPEIDIAIQDIVNEAVPQEENTDQIELVTDDLPLSDDLKDRFTDEFNYLLTILKYNKNSGDLFRRWYVDGRLYFQIIIDKDHPELGIQDLRLIDATKLKKVKEIKKKKTATGVDVIESIDEYFVFNEAGFAVNSNTSQYVNTTGVKISPDSVIYVPSGYTDSNTNIVLSYLFKAIRPVNQLRMLEDATLVYQIARAPERRIFYVDVGNLPKLKAEQYLKDMMNRYRNKMVYDASTGQVRDDKKYMSMLEDYWMPRRDGGKGTEISTLPGVQNMQGMLDNITYFQEKLYQSLNIPVSRLKPDTGFSMGRTSEISRDELKFQKFIDRLRNKFAQLFYQLLKTHLRLQGVVNDEEWENDLKDRVKFKFQKDNYFAELKGLDILQARMALMPQIDPYLGKYFSKEWVQQNILQMTDTDIAKMDIQIEAEKGDKTAQPTFQGGGDPSMMGGDPSQGGGDPFGGGDPSMSGGDPSQDGQQDPQYPMQ